jgi:hypothetical protein
MKDGDLLGVSRAVYNLITFPVHQESRAPRWSPLWEILSENPLEIVVQRAPPPKPRLPPVLMRDTLPIARSLSIGAFLRPGCCCTQARLGMQIVAVGSSCLKSFPRGPHI